MATTTTSELIDVLIVGGGPGGLAAATGIARQRFSVVVFDANFPADSTPPRTAAPPAATASAIATTTADGEAITAPEVVPPPPASAYPARLDGAAQMHNVLGWDHASPAAFRAKGRADLLARYPTVRFVDRAVLSATRVEGSSESLSGVEFHVTTAAADGDDNAGGGGGTEVWRGRKLVLATGSRDVLPSHIPGLAAPLYGRLIFPCLSCHGYEQRGGGSAGVLATGNSGTAAYAAHFARMSLPLARAVTVYTDGDEELAGQMRALLEGSEVVNVDARRVRGLEEADGGKGVLVRLEGEAGGADDKKVEAFLAHLPATAINAPHLATQLGLAMEGNGGEIKVNWPFNETSVSGVFAVGDCANVLKAVIQAVCMGGFAGSGITAQLGQENMLATKVKKTATRETAIE